jgi:hypothetical protein
MTSDIVYGTLSSRRLPHTISSPTHRTQTIVLPKGLTERCRPPTAPTRRSEISRLTNEVDREPFLVPAIHARAPRLTLQSPSHSCGKFRHQSSQKARESENGKECELSIGGRRCFNPTGISGIPADETSVVTRREAMQMPLARMRGEATPSALNAGANTDSVDKIRAHLRASYHDNDQIQHLNKDQGGGGGGRGGGRGDGDDGRWLRAALVEVTRQRLGI